jgi:hypothetical protein
MSVTFIVTVSQHDFGLMRFGKTKLRNTLYSMYTWTKRVIWTCKKDVTQKCENVENIKSENKIARILTSNVFNGYASIEWQIVYQNHMDDASKLRWKKKQKPQWSVSKHE